MNLRSTLFINRTRLFVIGVATLISLFCLNIDSNKAEAADGGLLPLGISVGSVQVIDQDQTKQKPENPVQTGSTSQKNQEPIQELNVPPLIVDTPAKNLVTSEVGNTVTKAVTNVSGLASQTTAATGDTAAQAVTNVSDIASQTTAAVGDTAAKAITNVSDIASKTTAAVGNTAAEAITNTSDIASIPPVVEHITPANLKPSGNSSEPPAGEGISKKNPKAEWHAVAIKSLKGIKRQDQPFPKSLPEKHSDVPILPLVSILQGENHGSRNSSTDNGGSNSFGKQSVIESPLIDVALPRYTGHLFNRRDIGINQWSQPPPEKPPQSTFFS